MQDMGGKHGGQKGMRIHRLGQAPIREAPPIRASCATSVARSSHATRNALNVSREDRAMIRPATRVGARSASDSD